MNGDDEVTPPPQDMPGGGAARSTPTVVIALDDAHRASMLGEADLARLRTVAAVRITTADVPTDTSGVPVRDRAAEDHLARLAADADALVVSHGAPRVTDAALSAPGLRLVVDLEGDRFAPRVDPSTAAEHGVVVVDTTHGSSWPVAEFALASAVLGLRDTGRYLRAGVLHEELPASARLAAGRLTNRELTGKRVGLIGFGHIGWRLVSLLRPFDVEITAHDPFAPRELADAADVTFGSLEAVLRRSDVVVCLAPLTPTTRGMVTGDHLRLLRPGSVFVNVSRGAVLEGAGLLAVARQGEVVFHLDVLDPEPVPVDHPLRDLPNVVLTPHLAGTTSESRTRFFTLAVDELLRFFTGLEPRAQLTGQALAGRGARSGPAEDG